MSKKTYTAKFSNGETRTRTSAREYRYVIAGAWSKTAVLRKIEAADYDAETRAYALSEVKRDEAEGGFDFAVFGWSGSLKNAMKVVNEYAGHGAQLRAYEVGADGTAHVEVVEVN
jgi:hypothetical protein